MTALTQGGYGPGAAEQMHPLWTLIPELLTQSPRDDAEATVARHSS